MSRSPQLEPETEFLNVDVDVLSRERLEPLAQALGSRVSLHDVGPEGRLQGLHFALPHVRTTVDARVRRLAALVQGLPPSARALWDSARTRDFSIGLQSGLSPASFELVLSPRAIRLVADVDARIVVTVYGAPRRNEAGTGRGSRALREKP